MVLQDFKNQTKTSVRSLLSQANLAWFVEVIVCSWEVIIHDKEHHRV